MEVLLKVIAFAICFPLGMSLLYGLRKKLKSAEVVSDSNFVKIPRKKYIFIGIFNILLFPISAVCFLGMVHELRLLLSASSKIDWEALVLQICLIAVDSYFLHLFFSFRKKIEIVDNETIKIFKVRKSFRLHRKDITYKCAQNIIRIYNTNGKRIISITHLYENTQNLIKWLESS